MSQFVPVRNASSFRKMAAAMWRRPNDPVIYGSLDVDASAALAFLEQVREKTGRRATLTHLVARAVAVALARHSELNAKVRFWGRLEHRRTVDLFLQVSTDDGQDLSGARIDAADTKSLVEIADEIEQKAKTIREGADATYRQSRDLFRRMPWWALRPLLRISDFLVNELHLDLASRGMPRDPFGSAMITSVGMFGIETGFAPMTPVARCNMIVLVSAVRERPWVVDGQLAVRPVLRLCATMDHRVIDGYHAGVLARELRGLLENPQTLAE
ncbi:MAG: 2-oxo acid dehydrogenase subunit E2 [Candidatus Schekmanbacteria bacterium]|nr:2-oxo acid dehydrogenase subunit E2 [Candidatus Schekmanbacteria bacterium]